MPTVPTYGGPRAQTQALRTPQERGGFTADELGDGTNRAVRQGIGLTAEIVADQRRKAQEFSLADKRNAYEEKITPLLAEYQQRGGLKAQTAIDDYRKEHEKIAAEIVADADPKVKEAFEKWSAGRRVEIDRNLTMRAAGEAKKYDAQVFEANGNAARERVRFSALDPAALTATSSERREEIRQFADRNGMPREWADSVGEAETSAMVRTVIQEHLSQGNDILAEQVLDRYKNSLTANDAQSMTRAVEASSTQGEAFRIGDEIYRKVSSGEMSKSEVMAAVKEMSGDNVKVRSMAEGRAMQLIQTQERAKAEQVSDMVTDSYAQLIENGGDLEALPPSVRVSIVEESPDKWEYLERVAQRRASGERPTTDRNKWAEFIGMATDKPNDIAQMSHGDMLQTYSEHLSDSDFKQALNIWSGIRQGDRNADAKANAQGIATGIRTEAQMMNATLRQLGVNPNEPRDAEEEAVIRMMDQSIASEKRRLGRETLEPQEVTKVIDSVIALTYKQRGRDLTELGQSIVQRVDQIPVARLEYLRNMAELNGAGKPSDRQLVDEYNRVLKHGPSILSRADAWYQNQTEGGGPQ
jgi:hypothetical protein